MDNDALLALLQADGDIITERLDHWARTRADRVFFHYGEDRITHTYAEFGRLSDHIAGNLAANGIAKGDRVSVLTTNSYVAALLMFGIWKAGAVYCPVNFGFSGRLLAYQLDDTAPSLLVTDTRLLPAVNDVAGQLQAPPLLVVYAPPPNAHDHVADVPAPHPRLHTLDWASLTAEAKRPDIQVGFDDPANIVYTSGTTGPAKGVVQPYRWMAQYTFGLRMPLTADDVIYSDLPMYHVGGAIANVARAAWTGCEVAVWDRFSPHDFWRRISSRGATTAILLDVMIPWLMQREPTADDRANTLNKVYLQPLPLHHAEVARRFGFDFVFAGFGQTESGAALSAFVEETAEGQGTPAHLYRGLSHTEVKEVAALRGQPVLDADSVTRKGFMGLPTPFCEVAVLDEHDRECRVEEPGQLAIRPRLPGLTMIEYLGKPEATVTAWRNLWLHTGDAAVRGGDGMLYFVDRLGDRMRVRGENLSSYQVEDMINQLSGVRYCAVFAVPSEEGDEDDVVAFVVPAEGTRLTVQDVHDHARTAMPKYMRPRIVRIVKDLPRTPTNKIEKYKLRKQILDERGHSPS
ncbi:AMP-binding protein [Streptomyces caeni]|uniref:AMP-binding protein n=1 Tax=Streptomyces caeni TaxID=2307231 RepID=A0ABW4IRB4_9ACTN